LALPFDPGELEYKPFSAECPRAAFSCDHEHVDSWFQGKALTDHGTRCRLTTIHVRNDPEPVGFYALSFAISQLNRRLLPAFLGFDKFPSLRLEWLGVRTDLQGQGFGTIVMGRVLSAAYDLIELANLPAMTVIPANDRSERFYKRIGFVDLANRAGPQLVLPASDIVSVVNPPSAATATA
jgi:GNAT superfamily N-acetyltransferase